MLTKKVYSIRCHTELVSDYYDKRSSPRPDTFLNINGGFGSFNKNTLIYSYKNDAKEDMKNSGISKHLEIVEFEVKYKQRKTNAF